MAIVDPTYLYRERNQFPSLTDKEFDTLCIFCQTASYEQAAEYRECKERQVRRNIQACKNKLGVVNDFGLFLIFIQRCADYRKMYPTLSEEQATLLYIYALLGNQIKVSYLTGYPRREIHRQLIDIKDELRVKDVHLLKWSFVIRLTIFKG